MLVQQLPKRIYRRINFHGGLPVESYRPVSGECWIWTGYINKNGYGQSNWNRIGVPAHRLVYRLLVGPVELPLDHVCRVKGCVNPDHVEPVEPAENQRRQKLLVTHCPSGHEYDTENTYLRGNQRGCRRCRQDADRRYKQRRKLPARNIAIIISIVIISVMSLVWVSASPAGADDVPVNTPMVVASNQSALLNQWIQLTPDQQAGIERLVAFTNMTANWTMADWWNFGIMSTALHDNDLANNGDRDAIHRVIQRVWGPDAGWAYVIVQRESGFNPQATNRSSGACGLFQMLGHEDMFRAAGYGGRCHEAVANIEVAYNLFNHGRGRSNWDL